MAHKRSKKQNAAIHAKLRTVDINTNLTSKKKNFKMMAVDPMTHKKIPGSETIVRSAHYGQAVDDFILNWNTKFKPKSPIGYPNVTGKLIHG